MNLLKDPRVLSLVGVLLIIGNTLTPVVPSPYKEILTALVAVLVAVFHIQSHSEASLGKAGYYKDMPKQTDSASKV